MAGATAAVGSATNAVYAGAASLKATQAVVSPAWQRDQEADADYLGADLTARAGWNPGALATALAKMKTYEDQKTDDAGFAESFKDLSASAIGPNGVNTQKLTDGLKTAAIKWLAETAHDMAQHHPDTGLRITEVTVYVDGHYPEAQRPQLKEAIWAKTLGESSTKKILANYTDAEQAEAKLAGGDRRGAEKLARSATSGSTKDHVKPVLTLVAIEEGGGNRNEAARLVQGAMNGPEPSFVAYLTAAKMAESKGDHKESVRILETAWTSLDRPPEAIQPLILAYKRNKQDNQASLLSAECMVRYPKAQMAGLCSTEPVQSASR
jgi:predicted Zn-dependent protease